MKVSMFDVIKISFGIMITKIVWDSSEVLKCYLTDKENLYKISRSIEHDNIDEAPEEIKREFSKSKKLDKIGF